MQLTKKQLATLKKLKTPEEQKEFMFSIYKEAEEKERARKEKARKEAEKARLQNDLELAQAVKKTLGVKNVAELADKVADLVTNEKTETEAIALDLMKEFSNKYMPFMEVRGGGNVFVHTDVRENFAKDVHDLIKVVGA